MAQLPRVGDQFGRYLVDAQIGFGGMGVVFAATDLGIDRRVALKVVSAALGDSREFLLRFEREAALLARLDSPHVIGIFDYGEHDGCPYIATQYVAGGDLGALIQARGPMPPNLAATVCAQVADALTDAHRAGVVHRDVKPSNVLLRDPDSAEVHAYLCDFGIARTADQSGLTMAGSVSGTWTYLAPECGAGQPATPASDIYAVGCLLWATLTGQPPFRGTDVEVAIAHQRAALPDLAGDDVFSLQVNEILRLTLAKDPARRYADADRLRTDLLAAAALPSAGIRPRPIAAGGLRQRSPSPASSGTGGSGGRLSLGSLPTGPPPAAPRRRRTAAIVAAACVGVLAVAGGIVALTRLDPDDPGGPFTTPSPTAPTTGDSPTDEPTPVAGIRGDRNADGLGDLVAERTLEGKDTLVMWTSTGTSFGAPVETEKPLGKDVTQQYFEGDLDGDGADELVRLTYQLRTAAPLQLTWTTADGTRTQASVPTPSSTALHTVLPGDVDGDGRDDLVICTWDEKVPFGYAVARSTGEGFSDPEPWLSTTTTYARGSTEVGDVDGDGRADVVVLTTRALPEYQYRSTAEVFLSTGSAFASDGMRRGFGTGLGPDLLSGDVDGDDDAELVVIDVYASDGVIPVHVLDYGDGLGGARVWGLISNLTSEATLSDVDGDGRDDVVDLFRTDSEARALSIEAVLSTGSSFAGPVTWATWKAPRLKDSYVDLVGSTFP